MLNYHRDRFKSFTVVIQPLSPRLIKPNYQHERFQALLIHSDEGLMLETPAFLIFHSGNFTFINSFDKTKF